MNKDGITSDDTFYRIWFDSEIHESKLMKRKLIYISETTRIDNETKSKLG